MLENKTIKSRKTRSDKFPLTLHPTGQFCKKIRGKLYYFGNDKKIALQRYLEQAAYLHAGKTPQVDKKDIGLSIRQLCNLYLENQHSRVSIGQIKMRHIYDQTILLRDFVKFIGHDGIVSNISTMDIQNYIRKLIKDRKAANTVNHRIASIKAMYNWALDNEIINNGPNLKVVKKITLRRTAATMAAKSGDPFAVQKLLGHADLKMATTYVQDVSEQTDRVVNNMRKLIIPDNPLNP